jgi:uncharacterized membrane protein (UPF0127 family)
LRIAIAAIIVAASVAAAAGIILYQMNSQFSQAEAGNADLNSNASQLQSQVRAMNLSDTTYLKAKATVNGFVVYTDVAATPAQQIKGLDIKDHLDENQGMLFVFDHEMQQAFWMKGMKFPIDIIWLDSNGRVVHIENSLPPCPPPPGFCPTYSPGANSLYVLEVMSGFAQKHGVMSGTQIQLQLLSRN